MRDIKPALQFLSLALGDEVPRIARRAAVLTASLLALATFAWMGL